MIKKTLVLTGDKPMGYITVVRVGNEVGAKIVGETFTSEMKAYIKIGENAQTELLVGKKTELSLHIPMENADDVRCAVARGEEIVATGGNALSKKETDAFLKESEIIIPKDEEKEPKQEETRVENFTEPTKEEEKPAMETEKKESSSSAEAELLSGLRTDTNGYYIGISDKVDELFVVYPAEKNLQELIPDSEWVKVQYEEDGYYVIGRLKDEGKVKYMGYGVPGVENVRPPKVADGIANWFLAPTAADADAWSTALFVLGPEAGRSALERRPRVSALWVLAEPDGGVRLVPSGATD